MEQCGDLLLLHDPIWLGADADETTKPSSPAGNALYVSRRKDAIIGYAPFTCGWRTLRFAIGELIVLRRRLRSFTLMRDIVAGAEHETRVTLALELLRLFAERLRPDEGLFLEGIPTDSVLFQVVSGSTDKRLLTLRLGEIFDHQFIKLPPNFRDYEVQLGSHARKHLRYELKKLLKEVSGDLRVVCFTDIDRIPDFIVDAQNISRKTYQWRLLGLGFRDAAGLQARLNFAARNNWLRSYILYCRGEPVAFMLGYLYRRAYHYIDVGYDPAWAKWGVGSILQMEVMKDLLGIPDPPELFDFSTGSGTHKARFGNTSRPEINLLLIRNCPRNAILATGYAVSAAADKLIGAWTAKLGIKARVKRWLRRLA